jgi:hypothetical protein
MHFYVYLIDRSTNCVQDSFVTFAADRSEALRDARALGWPVSRTYATSRNAYMFG